MKKSKVYTRTGDKGETSLVSGTRIIKSDARIDLYGEVDELNSYIGLALCELKLLDNFADALLFQKIQSSLFDLGSNLACEFEKIEKFKLPQVEDISIQELELKIDFYDSQLEPMKFFILPTGNRAASNLHVARTICRKVERKAIAFSIENDLPKNTIQYLNRLSDFLFVASRYANFLEGIEETPWIPTKG